jgi:hypothetical protein
VDAARPPQEAPAVAPRPPGSALAALAGTWRGAVHSHERPIPVVLEIDRDGRASARLDGAAPTVLEDAVFDGDELAGVLRADLRASDDRRHPPAERLDVHLLRRGERLEGQLCATFPSRSRSGDDYGYFLELTRA